MEQENRDEFLAKAEAFLENVPIPPTQCMNSNTPQVDDGNFISDVLSTLEDIQEEDDNISEDSNIIQR